MAKSQQTFNKLEKEKKRKKKKEDKRKKMLARKEAKENGDLVTNEFVYVDYNGNFTDTPPDPAEKEKISAESIVIGIPKSENVKKDGYTGKVSFFDHSKGFGFIVDPETQEQFFVHISECIDEIKEGNKVSFDTVKGTKGLNAVKVKVIG
ncbi:MAG: cold shock domain-containing protein [Flavobacteriaceae bacterium]|nr:cold shock domain-containing protein [Flavobacteriaceae bacterium]